MILYIAGKITGTDDYKERFQQAEEYLKARGDIVLNPTVLPSNMPKDRYLPICLAMIDQADGLYLLRGYGESEGAKIERRYAEYQGKWVEFE